MFEYQKILQYPINIKNPNAKFAQIISSQYGGAECRKIYTVAIKNYVWKNTLTFLVVLSKIM